ncbi:hypothetical protein C8F04DRAFT_981424 [Mycena alexandri]|uniref:Uncharacterized protein n=1 Tax=Mycena alexandri TaxID=1745969 RepID=A0AAD6RW94_9AGAR|nr:hypothetical protein C8F04DRAFT_981424 [Mycena alexandri]
MEYQFVPSEPNDPSQTPSATNAATSNLRWSQYTPETASRSRKAPLKQSSIASDIPLDKLKISPAQREQLQQIYESNATATPGDEVSRVDYFYTCSDDDQLAASAIMAQQGLDIGARERIDNRWSQQWGRASNLSAKAKTKTRRVLYSGTFSVHSYQP